MKHLGSGRWVGFGGLLRVGNDLFPAFLFRLAIVTLDGDLERDSASFDGLAVNFVECPLLVGFTLHIHEAIALCTISVGALDNFGRLDLESLESG